MHFGTDEISAAEHIRNEGVDKHLDMNMQVSRTCSLHLRNIGLMHHYGDNLPNTEHMVNAMVTSVWTITVLQFGNANNNIAQIQHLQNAASNLLT